MKLPKNQQAFFLNAVTELMDHKVDLHFSRTKKVDGCAGYFCHKPLMLKVGVWNQEWFSVFLHEFCHFKQWKAQTKLWVAAEDMDFIESFDKNERSAVQLMEQECDIMAWFEIQRWGLEKMDKYVAQANAYHVSYCNLEDRQKWFKHAPYGFEDIVDMCPNDRFYTKKELDKPEPELYSLINEKCF